MIKTKISGAFILLASVFVHAPVAADGSVPALTGTTGEYTGSSWNHIGWAFDTSVPITVTALGWYDYQRNGLIDHHPVQIWDNAGNLLISGTVPAGIGGSLLGDFRYTTTLTLESGSYTLPPGHYVIGGDANPKNTGPEDGLNFNIPLTNITTATGISYVSGRSASDEGNSTFPNETQDWCAGACLFGPNFQISVTPKYGLVAYYPFTGNAKDQSGYAHNGVVRGAALTSDRFGNTKSAYNFNGTSSYIQIPASPDFNISKTGFSVSAWIKPNPVQYSPDGFWDVIDKSHTNDDLSGWVVQSYQSKGFGFIVENGIDQNVPAAGTNTNVLDNKWHHFVGVFDYSQQQILFYLDGVLASVTSNPGTPEPNARDLFIGKSGYLSGGRNFRGVIDEVRVYNRPISKEEVIGLYGENNAVYGCVSVGSSPLLANQKVTLKQADVANKTTTTNETGCYYFPKKVESVPFSLIINGNP